VSRAGIFRGLVAYHVYNVLLCLNHDLITVLTIESGGTEASNTINDQPTCRGVVRLAECTEVAESSASLSAAEAAIFLPQPLRALGSVSVRSTGSHGRFACAGSRRCFVSTDNAIANCRLTGSRTFNRRSIFPAPALTRLMFSLPTTTAAAAWVRPIAVRAHAGVLLLRRYVRARGRALIRLLVAVRAWLLPPAIFWLVYLALSLSWTVHYGVSAWAPAWPVARTRFVLTLCAAPITASILLVLVLLFTLAHRVQDRAGHMYHDYELFGADSKRLVDPHHSSESAQHRTARMTLWPRVIAVFYAIVVALGAYAAATWEQPLDHVYKADVIKAVALPRPSGYSDGGPSPLREPDVEL
jgi:hypothetical protein